MSQENAVRNFELGAWAGQHHKDWPEHRLAVPDDQTPEGIYCLTCRATPDDPAPALVVEISATVRVQQRVDLVAHYADFQSRARLAYAQIDLLEVGFNEEWERPIAWLWPDQDRVEVDLPRDRRFGAPFPDLEGDVDVTQRGSKMAYGSPARHWSEDDFEVLAAAVPWIGEVHKANEAAAAAADEGDTIRARHGTPGPADVPLAAPDQPDNR